MSNFIEKIIGDFSEKRRWKEYKARVKALPAPYRTAAEGVERYVMYTGAITKGDTLVRMLEDLADLFEQAAADQTPIRTIVGEDPVEFATEFLANYAEDAWVSKERKRLHETIARAEKEDEGS
jgi:DNA-binding ferritin-like protein (Dps family)